jgi:dienelactone hydrolase
MHASYPTDGVLQMRIAETRSGSHILTRPVARRMLGALRSVVTAPFLIINLALCCESSFAQTPLTEQQQQASAATQQYFRRATERLASTALADVNTLEDWQRQRPLLRAQLLEMLGLDPLPERTDLHAAVTGTVELDDFVVEKLHFQSRPGLYVTANFYRPRHVDTPLPTILYLCGHGNVKIDGVSYGSKASYQHHPAWFAREGYCCLILDTLQLGEIEGLHHGTYREGMWWWLARGYTPAGVEAWNAVRALDYLETRPEVDMKRIGVTGRSGGGAYTWWLAAIDDRPACFVPVAGITDLENHIVDGCIEGHCDCMFMVNTYGWNFDVVAALAAPRPLLFSNSDKDTIFPLTGVVRTHAKLKRIYELHNASDKLGLLITEGPHKDTQELQVPAFRWMNRWLKGKDEPITRVADKPLDPKQLKVFQELPEDQRNTSIHETFVPIAECAPPPKSREEWESLRANWLTMLQDRSLRGWPKSPPELRTTLTGAKESGGVRLRVFEYSSDDDTRLTLYELGATKWTEYSAAMVTVLDRNGWEQWRSTVGSAFGDLVPGSTRAGTGRAPDSNAADFFNEHDWARVYIAPRGVGPSRWVGDRKKDTHIQRRFALLGQSWDGMQVWDVCRAIQVIKQTSGLEAATIRLDSDGAQAGIALYAGIFCPAVDEIHLRNPSRTHRDGPYFLNVLRYLDMPQAIALAFPRKVIVYDSDPAAWEWTRSVAKLFGEAKPPLEFSN